MFYRKNFNRKFSNGLSLILLGFFFSVSFHLFTILYNFVLHSDCDNSNI